MKRSDRHFPALVAMVKSQHMAGNDAVIVVPRNPEEYVESLRPDFPADKQVSVVGEQRVLIRRPEVDAT